MSNAIEGTAGASGAGWSDDGGAAVVSGCCAEDEATEAARPQTRVLSGNFAMVARAATAPAGIPDAVATVSDPSLRYTDLNREINAGYAAFAERFQAIVDPGFTAGGRSEVAPVWFAFAPFASREVGRSMLAAEHAIATADLVDRGGDTIEASLARAGLGSEAASAIVTALEAAFPCGARTALAAASFLVTYLAENARLVADTPGAIEQLLDPRHVIVATQRLVELMETAPGAGTAEKLGAIATTLRNALEDGNRAIYGDIGGAAQSYLEWRDAQPTPPDPARVLEGFRLPGSEGPPRASEVFDQAVAAAARGAPFTDFGRLFPAPAFDSRDLVVAGFALYEQAGRTAQPAEADRLIAAANNLLAWREQFDAARPAFDGTKPGEVDRGKLFELMTPWVRLPLRDRAWGFSGFASEHLPRADWNPLTPRAAEYNWARFEDRWPGILAAFETAYEHRGSVWPMPSPDPSEPA